MVKVLEAEARISATDNTGGTIDAIAGKLKRLSSVARSVSNDLDRHMAAAGRAGEAMDRASRFRAGAASVMRGARGAAGVGAAVVGSHAVRTLFERTAHAVAQGQHERVRMDAAGMSGDEIKEAEEIATKITEKYKSIGQTSILHAARNVRSVVGTFEEATKILDPLMKLRVVAEGAHPERAEQLGQDFDQLVKGMEIKGVTQNLPRFVKYMDGMAKALNVFGDTLRPTDYYEMFKYGRQATQALGDKFMLMTAPTLAQELGGSSAGQAMGTFYQTVIGGRMKDVAARELNKFGLLDPSKIVRTKTGAVKGILPGGVMGARMAASDPYAWVNEVFLPALAKKGITEPEQIQDEIAAIFRDRTAAQMVGIFATQQSRIQKDWNLVGNAKGLEGADAFLNRDPYTAKKAVGEQLNNLLQAAASPAVAEAGPALNRIAEGLNALANAARENPIAGMAGLGTAGAVAGGTALWGTKAAFDWFGGRAVTGAGAFGSMARAVPWLGAIAGLGAVEEGLRKKPLTEDDLSGLPEGTQRSLRTGYDPNLMRGISPAFTEPVKAQIEGNATLGVTVEVSPSADFMTKIKTMIDNGINAFRASGGAPPSGTSGSSGRSMPEAAPAQ